MVVTRSSHVPSGKAREVSPILKAIHAQKSKAAARRKINEIIGTLRAMKLGRVADLVAEHSQENLTFAEDHWVHIHSIHSNNPMERSVREI